MKKYFLFIIFFSELNIPSDFENMYLKCYKYHNVDFLQPSDNLRDFDVEINPDNNIYLNAETDCSYVSTEQTNNFLKSDDGLSIMQINSRSLNKNFDKLDMLIDGLDKKTNIISIAETWLKSDTPLSPFSITGYTLFNSPRTLNKSRGAGVALYGDNNFDSTLINKFTVENGYFKCIGISIKSANNKVTNIVSLYRPPDTSIDDFTASIEALLINNNQQTYVCGDFNIDLIKYKQHEQTDTFVNKMFSLGYKPLIKKPTRITAYSSTLIDNIFTNVLDLKHRSGVVIADISDHLPIIINSLSIKNLQINSFRSHKRKMLHKDKFIDELKNADWDFITNCTDVNSSYNTFIDFFLNSLDKHCPYESKLIQIKHNKKPWISKSLITACKKKIFYINFFYLKNS